MKREQELSQRIAHFEEVDKRINLQMIVKETENYRESKYSAQKKISPAGHLLKRTNT